MSWARVILLLLLCGQLGAASAPAADKPASDPKDGAVIYPQGTATSAEPVRGAGSGYTAFLFTALLMAGAGGWLYWRGRVAPGGNAQLRKLAIAETKSLGNRQYLVVATYEDKKFLLGVCPGRIEMLTPLDGEKGKES